MGDREIFNMKVVSAVIFFIIYWSQEAEGARNVLGSGLEVCSVDPMTGWFRDGYCRTNHRDHGIHVVCAKMTEAWRWLVSLCCPLERSNECWSCSSGEPSSHPRQGSSHGDSGTTQ